MEERLMVRMAHVDNDAAGKLEVAEELYSYFRTKWRYRTSRLLSRIVGRLIDWLRSSSLQIQLITMKIFEMIIKQTGTDFQLYLTPLFLPLVECLGSTSTLVQNSAQGLFQVIMNRCVQGPHSILDQVLETCLAGKSLRMKCGGLICLIKTLQKYGVNQVRFIKHIQQICLLLRDKDSRIQELGLNALVEIYQEIREDLLQVLPKCNMSAQKRIQLEASFKMADAKKWSGYLVAKPPKPRQRYRSKSPRWNGSRSPDVYQSRQSKSDTVDTFLSPGTYMRSCGGSLGHVPRIELSITDEKEDMHRTSRKRRGSLSLQSFDAYTSSSMQQKSHCPVRYSQQFPEKYTVQDYEQASSITEKSNVKGLRLNFEKQKFLKSASSSPTRHHSQCKREVIMTPSMLRDIEVVVEQTVRRVLMEFLRNGRGGLKSLDLDEQVIATRERAQNHPDSIQGSCLRPEFSVNSLESYEVPLPVSDVSSVHFISSEYALNNRDKSWPPSPDHYPLEKSGDNNTGAIQEEVNLTKVKMNRPEENIHHKHRQSLPDKEEGIQTFGKDHHIKSNGYLDEIDILEEYSHYEEEQDEDDTIGLELEVKEVGLGAKKELLEDKNHSKLHFQDGHMDEGGHHLEDNAVLEPPWHRAHVSDEDLHDKHNQLFPNEESSQVQTHNSESYSNEKNLLSSESNSTKTDKEEGSLIGLYEKNAQTLDNDFQAYIQDLPEKYSSSKDLTRDSLISVNYKGSSEKEDSMLSQTPLATKRSQTTSDNAQEDPERQLMHDSTRTLSSAERDEENEHVLAQNSKSSRNQDEASLTEDTEIAEYW